MNSNKGELVQTNEITFNPNQWKYIKNSAVYRTNSYRNEISNAWVHFREDVKSKKIIKMSNGK